MRKVIVLLMALSSVGCWAAVQAARNSTLDAYKTYEGPHLMRQQIAVVTRGNREDTHVVSFDGKKDQDIYSGLVLETLPGPHHLCVSLYGSGSRSRGCVNLDFVAEAGHAYELHAVSYTHKPEWYPAVLDITAELGCTERQATAEQVEALLRNARKKAAGGAEIDAAALKAQASPCPWGSATPPGSGEKRSEDVDVPGWRKVRLAYQFDRYQPYVLAHGDDGTTYHVKLAVPSGGIERVLGRTVEVGGFGHYRQAFRPLGSSFAYANLDNGSVRVYEEKSPGKYEPCAAGSTPPPLE